MDDILDYPNAGPGYYADKEREIADILRDLEGSEDDYRKRALEAQMESASEARKNAMEIAKLQSETSRYGIDVASRDRMRALKENARQFDLSHGLDIAEAYTKFASTPDMMFARNDFLHAMGRVSQGLMPSPVTSHPTQPRPKTYEDFAALSRYQGPGTSAAESSTVPAGNSFDPNYRAAPTAAPATTAPSTSGSGSPVSAQPVGAPSGSGTDPRMTAATAVMKAIPPSETAGADGQDWAALEAIRALYTAAAPGSLERLGAGRRKIAQAGLARLGYDVQTMEEDYRRSLPGQMSPLVA